jgi:hypothetical protein
MVTFSRLQSVAFYFRGMFRVIGSAAVAVFALTQADQYLYQGRYTDAAMFIFHKIAIAVGVAY